MSRTRRSEAGSKEQVVLPGAQHTSPVRHLHQIELARRWNISPRTLENWRWLGQGPAYLKVGGRVLYRIEDVETFEAANLRTSVTLPHPPKGNH
jgi:Helix-turn-helix domain